MKDDTHIFPIDANRYTEFAYRLIYLRPSPYSEERIAVGLVADGNEHVEVRFLGGAGALDLMTLVFGEAGVEQFQFAAGELRRAARVCNSVESMELPTDLLVAGELAVAYTADRVGFVGSALSAASAFLRANSSNVIERVLAADAAHFSQEVLDEVSRLNPFLADRIFHRTVNMKSGVQVEVPILGDSIFGAPISFASRDHKMRAEAYVAKFNWIRNEVMQQPRIYVKTPSSVALDVNQRLERSVREISAIADAVDVPVVICESTEELALAIVKDEAA
jgi:hypothetical protein